LAPGDDLTRVVRRQVAPDLVLGGGAPEYRRLVQVRWLVPVERTKHPLWCGSRRAPIGMAMNPRALRSPPGAKEAPAPAPAPAGEPPAPRPNALTFDDFRHDPIALAWARGQLEAGTWSDGYARLVR